jgi:hypothetical protein
MPDFYPEVSRFTASSMSRKVEHRTQPSVVMLSCCDDLAPSFFDDIGSRSLRILQPASNPDLAPKELFLFEYLKQQFQGIHVPDRESLKSEIIQIFSEIDPDALISVLEKRIKRFKWVIRNGGEYSNNSRKKERCACSIGKIASDELFAVSELSFLSFSCCWFILKLSELLVVSFSFCLFMLTFS